MSATTAERKGADPDEDAEPRCPCMATRHGPEGCPEAALPHPEDAEDLMVCDDCAPFEAIGAHRANWAAYYFGHLGGYPTALLDEANADRELVRDETGGRGFSR